MADRCLETFARIRQLTQTVPPHTEFMTQQVADSSRVSIGLPTSSDVFGNVRKKYDKPVGIGLNGEVAYLKTV